MVYKTYWTEKKPNGDTTYQEGSYCAQGSRGLVTLIEDIAAKRGNTVVWLVGYPNSLGKKVARKG